MTTVSKIGIGVVTSSNLKERYNACKATWLKDFENTYLFGGNGNDTSLINIIEAGEDYNSHFLKQQLGLKYMYEDNDSYDWYCMTSCDAILFKESTTRELSNHNHNDDIILGQPCGNWTMNPIREIHNVDGVSSDDRFIAIAGGGGFFISNALMKKCYRVIDDFNTHWLNVSSRCYPYSDVAISYMVKKYFNLNITNLFYLLSQPPKHYEDAIFYGNENSKWYENNGVILSDCLKSPMSFHYIKPNEMYYIYNKYK